MRAVRVFGPLGRRAHARRGPTRGDDRFLQILAPPLGHGGRECVGPAWPAQDGTGRFAVVPISSSRAVSIAIVPIHSAMPWYL